MPVLHIADRDILFIHIPKTGGTSVESWLGQNGRVSFLAHNPRPPFGCSPQHMTWADLHFLFGNKKWAYQFAIVRNPYERLESEFAFRFPHLDKDGLHTVDFATFVNNHLDALESNPYVLDNHLRPQTDFLAPDVRVFRFEDGIDKIIETVAIEADLIPPESPPHEQKRRSKPVFSWATPLLRRVEEVYQDDFELLEYEPRPYQKNSII